MTKWNPDKIHYLTQSELKRLLSVIKSKRDRALFLVAYRHGLRASEVGMLRISDIDFERHRIQIHRRKGSISGQHTLHPDEVKLLKSYLRCRSDNSDILFATSRTTPIYRSTLDYLTKRYGELASVPEDKRHFHALKHSIATHLLDAGADISFVQDWLEHTQIQNTRIYSKLTSRARDEQARKLFASPRII
jgi:integrase